jgi:hypothetical protein
MALIRHYTKPQYVQPILSEGIIQKERHNSYEEQKRFATEFYGYSSERSSNQMRQQESIDNQVSQYIGDYVWLTEECLCATAQGVNAPKANNLFFEFDSEEIGATKWHYLKKAFTDKTALKLVSAIDRGAKLMGDNPYYFWICENPVPIALAKQTGIFEPECFERREFEPLPQYKKAA